MQSVARTAARSARTLRPHLQRQQRRQASGGSGHGHDGPTTESFGAGFYISLAALPLGFALYKFSRQGTSEQPYFTRYIADKYAQYKNEFAERNDMHTQMIEQAASDRVLFLSEANANVRYVDLRFPEQFNGGAPWNVPAGSGYTNIDQVVEKYQRESNEAQAEKKKQLEENKVPREQPVELLIKASPGSSQ